ncbi:MAG TPA: hypothetical protein VGN57_07500 [Pirellulaceae bacterium]|nr:hypothetical protein [Pirellulaceae bacterium]
MSEEVNPYRFTGGASEPAVAPSEESPRSTLRELRSVAFARTVFAAAAMLHGGSILTLLSLAVFPKTSGDPFDFAPAVSRSMANACAWGSLLGLFLIGASLAPYASPRFASLKTIALLAPGLNLLVAFLLLRSASRLLTRHRVRLGWLLCDFSQAVEQETRPDSSNER